MGPCPLPSINAGLPVRVDEIEVGVDRIPDSERPGLAGGAVRPLDHAGTCQILRLPEAEDSDAIRIGEVICDGERLDLVVALADVVPGDPLAGALLRPAIAEV